MEDGTSLPIRVCGAEDGGGAPGLLPCLVVPQIGEVTKKRGPHFEVFNGFVDSFQSKLLMLLDDVEQFFLWAIAVVLDGRKMGFDWLKCLWEHNNEWPNITERDPSLSKSKAEL